MSSFDQRGQKVKKQTNIAGNQYKAGREMYVAGGDVRFGDARNQAAFAGELEKFLAELSRAAGAGEIEAEAALDVEHPLKKAVLEAKKPKPDKAKLLDYIGKAKTILTDLAAASTAGATVASAAATLGGMLGKACEAIKTLF